MGEKEEKKERVNKHRNMYRIREFEKYERERERKRESERDI